MSESCLSGLASVASCNTLHPTVVPPLKSEKKGNRCRNQGAIFRAPRERSKIVGGGHDKRRRQPQRQDENKRKQYARKTRKEPQERKIFLRSHQLQNSNALFQEPAVETYRWDRGEVASERQKCISYPVEAIPCGCLFTQHPQTGTGQNTSQSKK